LYIDVPHKHLQGQTRLARYYEDRSDLTAEERTSQEADIVRKCLMRGENQVTSQGIKKMAVFYFILGSEFATTG
jgi:hypothetical protein